jgi:drug/metabolite transporter (DMT)-like permease
MSDKQKGFIFILLASIFGGAAQPVVKVGLVTIPPLSFVFLRFLIAGLVVSPWLFKKNFTKSFWKLLPLSILGTMNIFFAVFGIERTSATIGQLLYAGVPILTVILLFILFKEKLAKNKVIGVLVGFLGIVCVVLLPIIEKGSRFSGNLLGNVLISGGVISWSLYMVYSRKALKNFSPFILTSVFIWATCFCAFPFFLMELSTRSGWWENLTSASLLSIGFSSVFTTIGAFLLSQCAIRHGGSVLASLQFYLQPMVAYLAASILLGEQLTLGIVVGGLLALLGVYITTKK